MKGKEKCHALREIRRQIALQNDITYIVSECSYQGNCQGTCPKCEAELRYLEAQLKIRQNLGKAIAVTGLAIATPTLTACDFPPDFRTETLEGATSLPAEYESPSSEYGEESGKSHVNPLLEETETNAPSQTEEIAGDISVPSDPVTEEDFPEELEGDIAIFPPSP